MDSIIEQIKTLAEATDVAGRKKIQDALQNVQLDLEEPYDMIQRMLAGSIQMACTRIAIDLGLFKILAARDEPQSLGDLAKQTNASPELLIRILRHLVAMRMLNQSSPTTFSPNAATKTLLDPNWEGAIHSHFDLISPVIITLPDYLKKSDYAPITTSIQTPFQSTFSTSLPLFSYLTLPPQHEQFTYFQQNMNHIRSGSFLTVFPFEEELRSWNEKLSSRDRSAAAESNGTKVFVDVAGGKGAQCKRLIEKFPETSGRVVLQDLEETVKGVEIKGVDVMGIDFFKEQPIKGAKFYYLRAILHDWPDEKCIEILQNIKPSMGEESKILVDDKILDDEGVHWKAAGLDICMMSLLGSKERTRMEWEELVGKAGLVVEGEWKYNFVEGNGILVLGQKGE